MSWNDIAIWQNKITSLNTLIGQMGTISSECEDSSNVLYSSASYMDGNVVGSRAYDNGILENSYNNIAQIYATAEAVKVAANNAIASLKTAITEEQNRLYYEEQQRLAREKAEKEEKVKKEAEAKAKLNVASNVVS